VLVAPRISGRESEEGNRPGALPRSPSSPGGRIWGRTLLIACRETGHLRSAHRRVGVAPRRRRERGGECLRSDSFSRRSFFGGVMVSTSDDDSSSCVERRRSRQDRQIQNREPSNRGGGSAAHGGLSLRSRRAIPIPPRLLIFIGYVGMDREHLEGGSQFPSSPGAPTPASSSQGGAITLSRTREDISVDAGSTPAASMFQFQTR